MIKRELSDLCSQDNYMSCMVEEGKDLLMLNYLGRLKAGEYVERNFQISPGAGFAGIDVKPQMQKKKLDTRELTEYIEWLRKAGYDIGKGEAEFGYRMPLPGKNARKRTLVIFRRAVK